MQLLKKKGSNFSFHPAKMLVLGFFSVIILGSILLSLPAATISGHSISYLDALFTATSAVCVTGLVVVDTGTTFSLFGQIVILSLIQVGGLGIMTFAALIAMALGKKISFKQRLLLQETFSQNSIQGIVRLVRYVLVVTFFLEILGALALGVHWYPEMGSHAFYYGLFHSISAFNNAGFDLMGNYSSLADYTTDFFTNFVVIFLIIAGGIGFFVLWDIYIYPRKRRISYHSKIVLTMTTFLIVFGSIVMLILEYNNPNTLGSLTGFEKIMASVFMAVTPRTAGFSTINVAGLSEGGLFFTMILMFVGASPGSTGGGIKTTTLVVVMVSLIANVRGNQQSVVYKKAISRSAASKAFTIFALSFFLVISTTFVLAVVEDNSFMNNLFEAVSAFGTVGLSTGITPDLTPVGKVAIIVTMFAGRVGPLTLAYVLGEKTRDLIKYPEGSILIG